MHLGKIVKFWTIWNNKLIATYKRQTIICLSLSWLSSVPTRIKQILLMKLNLNLGTNVLNLLISHNSGVWQILHVQKEKATRLTIELDSLFLDTTILWNFTTWTFSVCHCIGSLSSWTLHGFIPYQAIPFHCSLIFSMLIICTIDWWLAIIPIIFKVVFQ